MDLNKTQIATLSSYFSDLSKIVIGSTVIAFFVPTGAGSIPIATFTVGAIVAVSCLIFSLRLVR